ncbi:phosphatidate cytidylyltransferase [Mesonia maritima]|uniref:Phosphatidate cytidylyltransferase n=1 Tax=Mesonia maritima TaxID=1793873 RepID=A0ABU1K8E0_9FLAO|nr:phosphatidate cytidylyltransferase [Mesonia maritima]MDR6301525.1 phosphatidate cytidylyltransferase [Mesonia maritima]
MKEFITRGLSGAFYAFLLIATVLVSEYTFWGLIFIFGIISLYELQKLLQLNSYLSYFIFIGFLLYFSVFKLNYHALTALLIFTIFVKILLLKDLMIIHKIPLFEGKKYLVVIFYLISSFIFLTLIPYYDGNYEPELLIGAFILVWVNDSFAYLVGKNFGRKKLFERISPKKTVEGFLGGLFFSLLSSYVIYNYTAIFDYKIWLGLAALISIFGTLGDLIQSKLKRQANVKDSGRLMPGHGGLLDRLDSILFAGTFIYAYLLIVQNVS